MGQAFDRDGNVLGEATGATKADVLKALEAQAPDAHEVRIRSFEEKLTAKTTDPMLQFFRYAHLPPNLRLISKPFCDLAHAIVMGDNVPESGTCTFGGPLPRNPERTVALRKLLEAKDCAVRAALYVTE